MPVIPTLRMLRQEDQKFQACLVYIVRPGLKKEKIKLGMVAQAEIRGIRV
jgi:hypothetical protein